MMPQDSCSSSAPDGSQSSKEPIAIVGMSCKFGGEATNVANLWNMLYAGKDSWSPIPTSRFDVKSLYHPDHQRPGRHNVKGGYFIEEDVTLFDAPFFGQAVDSAAAMDPQLGILLEGVYEALDNAGMPLEHIAGSNTSVYTAVFGRDNSDMLIKDPETIPTLFITGNGTAMFSNRVSHFFDFRGPSVTVDTGCSGSMAALHLAVQSLRSGEADSSVVGASACLLNPDYFIALSSGGILSPEGRCYAWDHRWGGYGRGEGVAVLVLKKLSKALEDGDRIHSVIRETAANQDGRTGTITSPSMDAQRVLIEQCYKRAGLGMSSTGYVEAHMTGTGGDPIEAESLARTFGKARSPGDSCLVGSVKTNIGHTEAVSGLAAIIKTTLILQHQVIPPNLNYEKTNPNIPLDEWNLQVPTTVTPWPADKPLRASINNFGYGGTNVHVILEAAPGTSRLGTNGTNGMKATPTGHELPHSNGAHLEHHENGTTNGNGLHHNGGADHKCDSDLPSMVYVVSSKDAAGAAAMNKQLSQYIEDASSHGKTVSPADLAYTLNERKSRFPWLTACRARKLQDLATKLNGPSKPTRAMPKPPRIGYVFNGQGAQWYRMGRELTDAYPVFDEALTKADQTLRTTYGAQWSLKEELLRDERTTKVHDVALAQPICVALQLCLVDLLQSWNIVPAAVASHSSGEIAAAYCAGCLSFQEALGVAYFRGSLAAKHLKLASTHVSTQVPGAMLAAGLSADEAQAYVNRARGKVVIACVNSPSSVTLSGDLPVIDEIAAALEDDDVFQRKLKVPMAYHSHHMESMAPEYGQILNEILPEKGLPPRVTFASPVTGELVDYGAAFGPQHWVRNLVNPVLFSEALKSMVFGTTKTSEVQAPQVDVLIEIGPHDMLAGPVRQTLGDKQLPYLSCLKRPANAVDSMQDLACELLMRGSPVSLREVNQTSAHAAKYIHDLPSYVWNHASSYHFESRLSREHRVRRFVPHELLGTPVPGANEHTPTWRNMLRVQDIDWLVDHQLESQVVLPGAGYITMAIEAVKLLKGQASTSGYRLRDVDIANALIIPAATGIETIFSLRPCSETQLDHRDWYDFELWSVGTDFRWTQHCSGSVAVDVSHPREQPEDIFSATADVTDVVEVDPEQIYVAMRGMNFWHGPAFQNLTRSRLLGSKSIADFRLSEAAAAGDYVLHPSTLDSVFQSCYGCFGPDAKEDAVFLPRRIGGLYVPVHFARQKPGRPELQTLIELSKLGKREAIFQAEIRAFDSDEEDGRSNRLRMQDLQLQRIQQEGDGQDLKRICAKVRWEADVLHDIPASMKETMKVWLTKSELDFQRRLRESSYHLLRAAWLQLRHESSEDWEEHHRKFFVWMEAVIREADSGELEPGSEKWQTVGDPQELYNSVFAEHVAGELLCKIGSRLVDIFRKTIMPLELMMEDGLLHRYYEEVPEKGRLRCLRNQFRQIMDLYITKEPGAKVLEIGGGTGSATIHALEALTGRSKLADGSGSGSLLGRFDFTDISAGFFDKAKTKFAAFESVMTYSRLDIETDPLQQGFTTASYDLIITAEVLHATKNLQRTLTHVRSLLKPGGKFVLVESTRGSLDSQLIFGVLPGWWLSEESERAEGPLIPASSWDRHLRATGFSGIEFEISDCEDGEVNFSTLMVTTAVAQPSFPSTVSIVVDSTTDYESKWLQELMGQLKPLAGEVLVENFHSVQSQSDRVYILALDIDTHVMESMQEETFEKLRKILINSHSIIWLSQGGLAAGESFTTSQAQGLLRTLRREDGSKRCVQIDFDAVSWADGVKATQHIIHVFRQTMDQNSANDVVDWEYAVKDSVLHVPRLYPDAEQDRACCPSAKPIPEPALFHETGRDVVWKASDDGLLDKAHFVERNALADEELPEGMVEVEPQAFGLNFRDVLIAMGMLTPDQDGMVHEAAGIVTRLGENTSSSGLKVGDRVCGVFSGFFASTSRTPWTSVVQIPDSMSWEEAVSIPYAFVTAHYGLITLARLKRTDRILIHSAAGGVGQAAIMIAQHIGAEIFVTCGTEDKRALLMEQYGLPSDHIFTSRDVSFALPLMAKTKGKGVDVVLNSLAGPLLKATWECMARFGRFIEIGKMDIEARRTLDMSPFGRGVMFAAVDLSQTRVYDPMTVHEALVASVELCRSGRARAVHPITAFPISDMRKAMQYMQRGQHKGKLVIVPRPGDQVPTIRRQPPLPLNDCNSTYLVVGGMTGVGQAITSWMIDQKTKNLVVVSRNATTHPLCLATREHARKNKCNLQVRDCDIADEQSFLALLNEIKATMPPIKGIIHAGMVLDDTVLERMAYTQWQTAIRPKVGGTLHLHHHIPDLKFFIMLSSTAGVVGVVSQSNYCAGGTFQDALARYRTARGQPAITIDLGRVEDVGYVHEAGDEVMERLKTTHGTGSVPIPHLLRMIEQGIREPLRPTLDDSQIVTCMPSYQVLPDDMTIKNDKRFGTLRLGDRSSANAGRGDSGSSARVDELLLLFAATGPTKAKEAAVVLLRAKIAELFNLEEEAVDAGQGLAEYGVDSLVAVQLRNWLSSVVKARVTIFEILQTGSLGELAGLVAERSGLVGGAGGS